MAGVALSARASATTLAGVGSHAGWSELPELIGELGEISVADADLVVRHLLERTCELIGASDVLLSFGVHTPGLPADDPLHGWRGTPAVRFGPNAERDAAILDAWYHYAPNLALDQAIVTLARTTGRPRAFLGGDLAPTSRLQGRHVRGLLGECGIRDRIVGGRPVTDGLELLFGAYRRNGSRCFTEDERDLVRAMLASISAVARRLALAGGMLDGERRLTPRERDVLRQLLRGLAEKEVAHELGLASRTLHHHVTALYRKLGVQSRAELMALFLGTLRRARATPLRGPSACASSSTRAGDRAAVVPDTASMASATVALAKVGST